MKKNIMIPGFARLTISILLIASSAAPWIVVYSDFVMDPPIQLNGFSVFNHLYLMFSGPDPSYWLRPFWPAVFFYLARLLGELAVFGYFGLSIFLLVNSKKVAISSNASKWIIGLLVMSVIPVFIFMFFRDNASIGWGSLAMIICIGAAITIEVINIYKPDKLYNPRST